MTRLIDADALADKAIGHLELATQRVADTPTNSPCYQRYISQVSERSRFLGMIDEAPTVEDTIIHCKDCRYQVKRFFADKRYKEGGYWEVACEHFGEIMGYWGWGGSDEEFCSDAKPKEEGDTECGSNGGKPGESIT